MFLSQLCSCSCLVLLVVETNRVSEAQNLSLAQKTLELKLEFKQVIAFFTVTRHTIQILLVKR